MIDTIARAFWHDLPERIGRLSSTCGVILSDGRYLTPWPIAAVLAPVGALTCGGLAAVLQSEVSFTYSIVAITVFAMAGAFGAGLGFYMLLGYISADLMRAMMGMASHQPHLAAKPIVYLVLATLVILIPLTVMALREEPLRLLRLTSPIARLLSHAILQGALVFAWAQATAFMIRPVWSFYDRSPEVAGIAPLQHKWAVFVISAVVAAGVRVIVETRGALLVPDRLMMGPAVGPHRRLPIRIAIPLQSALICMLLAGLVEFWWEAILLFAILLVPLTLQALAMRLQPVAWVAARVPLSIRIVLTAAAAYKIAAYVVEPAARSSSSFRPMIVSIVMTLFIAAILLPRSEP